MPARDDPMHDKLYKVRFITDHLGKRFAEEFTPHQQVAVDECMIPFRGRLSFKQYHKDKPTKWGVKVWMLADSQTGYNYSFDVYTGKDADLDTMQNIGKVSRVVLKFANSLFGKGYTIFFDRFYMSPNLLYWLRQIAVDFRSNSSRLAEASRGSTTGCNVRRPAFWRHVGATRETYISCQTT